MSQVLPDGILSVIQSGLQYLYHILGGNDVATDLIEDLKGLPTEPQKKKEGVEDDT